MEQTNTEGQETSHHPWKGFLTLYLPLLTLTIFLIFTFYFSRTQAAHVIKLSSEKHIISLQKKYIASDITSAVTDLYYLAHSSPFEEILNEESTLKKDLTNKVEQDFLQFSIAKRMYDQIRFLDNSGMEIVRVNFNDGSPVSVKEEYLQNKMGRYYFDDTFSLSIDEVFISPLDLNVEYGQVEQPLKPMIRLGMPVFGPKNQKAGIVLLNYFGSLFLNRFTELSKSSQGSTFLLNSSGYYLHNENPALEWGFMFPDGNQTSRMFNKKRPKAWDRIVHNRDGQFVNADGLFTFETVYPLTSGMVSSTGSGTAVGQSETVLGSQEYFWKLVSFVPQDTLYQERDSLRLTLGMSLIGLLFLFGIGSWKFSLALTLRQQAEKKRELLLTELKSTYLQLKSSQSQLLQSEKMASVGRLATGVAYEINNPLAGLMQNAEVLSQRLTSDMPANKRAAEEAGTTLAKINAYHDARDVPKIIRQIRGSGQKIAGIVSELLNSTSLNHGVLSSCNLADLLDHSIEHAYSEYGLTGKNYFHGIKIIREYAKALPSAFCEPEIMELAFLNILRNGAEAMQDNGAGKAPCFILRVLDERNEGMIRVEIEDNGHGMSDDTCKKIFEPFFTTKEVGTGTGLGLSTLYFIITENYGGDVSVKSQLGQGTKIIVRLPIEGQDNIGALNRPTSNRR